MGAGWKRYLCTLCKTTKQSQLGWTLQSYIFVPGNPLTFPSNAEFSGSCEHVNLCSTLQFERWEGRWSWRMSQSTKNLAKIVDSVHCLYPSSSEILKCQIWRFLFEVDGPSKKRHIEVSKSLHYTFFFLMQLYFVVVVTLRTHLVLSFWSGYIHLSLCPTTMSNGNILFFLWSPSYMSGTLELLVHPLWRWWRGGINPSGAWMVL